jgi:N-methylhydantoinase A/oxoprolinase/acetone carboxylase beta subunit
MCERTYEHVVRQAGRVLLEAALAHDPGLEVPAHRWGVLGDRLLEAVVAGRPFSELMRVGLGLARPLVAIGAPVGAYYPEVARRLGAPLSIPEHARVCNAVGAVAGVVCESVEILVNQPTFQLFRVHDPAGIQDYSDPQSALDHAERVSRTLALAAARRAGAADPQVDTSVIEKRAHVGPGTDYLAEAVVCSTAVGRPAPHIG